MLSAAALLALGASMTSFAAGWEKDEAGIWHYYDSDDNMVEGEWKKDGGKWFYLDEDGDMKTDGWVDDYYVGSDGAMLVSQWYYGFGDDEEQDDPDDDGEHWYYFNSKGKKQEGKKKIGGKTYYFTEEGKMRWGWYEEETSTGSNVYYLGDENEGWRAESQWLWLEKSGLEEVSEDDDMNRPVLNCSDDESDPCDDEGWYWFGSDGKMYYGKKQKKINGRYFMFNEHGQMLYEWINGGQVALGSNWALDGKISSYGDSTIGQMKWFNQNGSDAEDGSRATGWQKIDGSDDVGTSDDTKWYYIDKGNAKHADKTDFTGAYTDEGNPVFSARIKIDGKYFAFNEDGEMQDGLQFIKHDTYFFNADGYMQTGKQANVEEGDDSTYDYYFTTKNAGNGKGYTGEKNGYLYWKGKRCEAQDDYAIYFVDGYYWVVNSKGKLQKSDSKNYDIEQPNGEVVEHKFTSWTNKKKYKLAVKDTADDFVKENALLPFIQIEDTVFYADPSTGVGDKATKASAVTGDVIAQADADTLPKEDGKR